MFYPKEKIEANFPRHELEIAGRDGRFEDEDWRLRKDGSRLWARVVITALHDDAGELVGFAKVTSDLTSRQEADEALRRSEEQVRLLVQQVQDYAILIARSERQRRQLERRRTRYQGVHRGRDRRPLVRHVLSGRINRRRGTGSRARGAPETRILLIDDDEFDRLAVRRCLSEAGIVTTVDEVSTAVDAITRIGPNAYDCVVDQLREKEARFRTLANAIPQLAWITDAAGAIGWYNQRWYAYTGTTFEEMQGWGWQKVHHPDHVQGVVDRIRLSFEHGEPWEDTFPLRRADDEYRWFLSRAVPIKRSDGSISGWFGTDTDVTEQIETERLLREREAEFRTLANATVRATSKRAPSSASARVSFRREL